MASSFVKQKQIEPNICEKMKTYGLIGYKLGHSFSKGFFTEKFENEKLNDCEYINFELDSIEAPESEVIPQKRIRTSHSTSQLTFILSKLT